MLRTLFSGCLFVLASTPLLADTHLIAIDVLLIPDAKMMDVSSQWNAKMREKTPAGFELDAAHQPHVTLLQRHIKKEDLEEVLSAIAKLRDGYDLANLSMTANGLYHIPSGDQGLAGITIELSQQLRDLQNAVIETVNRYDAGKADETAYAEDPTGTPFDPYLFEYVRDLFRASQEKSSIRT